MKADEIWWSFRERIRLSTLCLLMFIVSIAMISHIYIYTYQISKLRLHESRPDRSGTPMIHWLILVPPSMVVLAVRMEFSIRESRNGWQIEMDQLEVCLGINALLQDNSKLGIAWYCQNVCILPTWLVQWITETSKLCLKRVFRVDRSGVTD